MFGMFIAVFDVCFLCDVDLGVWVWVWVWEAWIADGFDRNEDVGEETRVYSKER